MEGFSEGVLATFLRRLRVQEGGRKRTYIEFWSTVLLEWPVMS